MPSSNSALLLVPKPRVDDIPPDHPSRKLSRRIGGRMVLNATDTFFRELPQLHPVNLPLWDVEEALPPYQGGKLHVFILWPSAAV